jgi:energy-coupling factor transport system substrate-specific component
MSWQLASWLLIGAALVAGFAWYERGHPSAKVLALVATLAALAALGRLAFAPLPNVKPTTDIVLLSGYVLGGAPGFAVGTIAALASNFFFGQGPYTPFQMAGWGAIGVFGALLPRGLGRYSLAAACGTAGLAYGVWMDFHLWLLYTGHSLEEYGVIAARGIPFNLAHVAGNVAFCLLFGPPLVRALRRFRERFEITWHPIPVATALALVALAAPATIAFADSDGAADYVERARTPDGGFAGAAGDPEADPIYSGWAAIGLAASGRAAGDATGAYLDQEARKVKDIGDMERTILALRAAGRPTRALTDRLARRRRADGSYERLVNRSAFAVLAFRADGRRTDRKTIAFLERQQNRDGGWSTTGRGAPSTIDDTAATVQALRKRRSTRRAVAWLLRRQNPDGGFPLSAGDSSNAQSTAFAIQALVAAGRDPAKARRGGARSPLAYLRSLQQEDGSVRYSRTSDQTPTWVTAQALAALERRPLPVAPPRAARVAGQPEPTRAFVALLAAFIGW